MKVNDAILATYSNGKNYDGRIVDIRNIKGRDMVTVMHYTLQDVVVRYASLYMDKCESVQIIPVDWIKHVGSVKPCDIRTYDSRGGPNLTQILTTQGLTLNCKMPSKMLHFAAKCYSQYDSANMAGYRKWLTYKDLRQK